MNNGWAKWGVRLEIDFRQGSSNEIAGSVNWRSRIQVYVYVCGPGHGGSAVVGNTYLEGTYSEVYPDIRAIAFTPEPEGPGVIPCNR